MLKTLSSGRMPEVVWLVLLAAALMAIFNLLLFNHIPNRNSQKDRQKRVNVEEINTSERFISTMPVDVVNAKSQYRHKHLNTEHAKHREFMDKYQNQIKMQPNTVEKKGDHKHMLSRKMKILNSHENIKKNISIKLKNSNYVQIFNQNHHYQNKISTFSDHNHSIRNHNYSISNHSFSNQNHSISNHTHSISNHSFSNHNHSISNHNNSISNHNHSIINHNHSISTHNPLISNHNQSIINHIKSRSSKNNNNIDIPSVHITENRSSIPLVIKSTPFQTKLMKDVISEMQSITQGMLIKIREMKTVANKSANSLQYNAKSMKQNGKKLHHGKENRHMDRILHMSSQGFHAFNITASDRAGNRRHIPDTRHPQCLALTYNLDSTMKVSIIIVFHNEARSTLLRTIHSVLDRTPQKLIQEILLVDDASSNTFHWLHEPLTDYVKKYKPIHLSRLEQREGLVRARLHGAKMATGKIMVFLDSHVEVNFGWLEPLLYRIQENHRVIAVPQMDVINWKNLHYQPPKDLYYGTFKWNMEFKYEKVPLSVSDFMYNVTSSIPTPVVIGCAHAVDREYFFSTGAYDEGMEIWGGENIEHSFRTWMCGGRVEILPCSKVGHLFKPRLPYSFKNNAAEVIHRNIMRIVEVWLDDPYKKFYYGSVNTKLNNIPIDINSLERRKGIKSELKCRSFDWYMNNVIPEMPIPPNSARHFGQLKSLTDPSQCLHMYDYQSDPHLGVITCDMQEAEDQFFYLDRYKRLLYRDICILVNELGEVELDRFCNRHADSNYVWIYDQDNRGTSNIIHNLSKMCIRLSHYFNTNPHGTMVHEYVLTLGRCEQRQIIHNLNSPSNRIKSHPSTSEWGFTYKFNFNDNNEIDFEQVLQNFISKPKKSVLFGELVNIDLGLCLQVFEFSQPELVSCSKQPIYEKIFNLNQYNELKYKNLCFARKSVAYDLNFDNEEKQNRNREIPFLEHKMYTNQYTFQQCDILHSMTDNLANDKTPDFEINKMVYDSSSKHLVSENIENQLCLSATVAKTLTLVRCDMEGLNLRWEFNSPEI